MGNGNTRPELTEREIRDLSLLEAPLPIGWEKIETKNEVYFVDHVSKQTTYKDPRLSASASRRIQKTQKKKPPKGKPPKYEVNFHSKKEGLIAQLHSINSDEGKLDIVINRHSIFEDSIDFITNMDVVTLTRRLFVKFIGEPGLDYGGMSREWFLELSSCFVDRKYKLLSKSENGHYYAIDRNAKKNTFNFEHFYFLGLVIGMVVYHAKLLTIHFSPNIYKSLLGKKLSLIDLKDTEESIYESLVKIQNEDVTDWGLDFSIMDKDEDGKVSVVELKPGGQTIDLTNENKNEYVELMVNYYLLYSDEQLEALKTGLYQLIPLEFLKDFDEKELEQIISGIDTIDINDLKANTEYVDIVPTHPTVKFFWEVVSTLSNEDLQNLLLFCTGSTRVPIGGFAHLYGSNGPQKFQIKLKVVAGLPVAHACFNRLELNVYKSKEKLSQELLLAIRETKGFGLE